MLRHFWVHSLLSLRSVWSLPTVLQKWLMIVHHSKSPPLPCETRKRPSSASSHTPPNSSFLNLWSQGLPMFVLATFGLLCSQVCFISTRRLSSKIKSWILSDFIWSHEKAVFTGSFLMEPLVQSLQWYNGFIGLVWSLFLNQHGKQVH